MAAREWAWAAVLLSAAVVRAAEVRVTVDAGEERGDVTGRASGLLLSMTVDRPPDELVAPLKFRCFRGRLNDRQLLAKGYFDRLKRLGVGHVQAVTVFPAPLPGEGGDWSRWERYVRSGVRKARDMGMKLEWDVWNEPNGPHFWPGDRARFFEAWKRAVKAIREEDPEAVVVGPSTSRLDWEYMGPFLKYAKENDVLPDVLSWHELRDGTLIPALVAEARKFLADNGMEVRRISINEIIPRARQFSPGVAVVYFANLEAAGVDGACHSCWPEGPERLSTNCERPMLDGLVSIDGEKRAAWWAYKGYADLAGKLVAATCDGDMAKRVAAMAARDDAAHVLRVLVGNGSDSRGYAVRVAVTGAEKVRADRVRVVVERIVARGSEPVKEPQRVTEEWRRVEREMSIDLPELLADEVFLVTVGRSVGQ